METPLEQTRLRLGSLVEINQLLMSTVEPDEVLEVILESAIRLFVAEGCSIGLLDDTGQHLAFVFMAGPAKAEEFRVPIGHGIAGSVAQTGEGVISNDVSRDSRWFRGIDQQTGFATQSILCVPLKQQDQIIGVIEALNTSKPDGFTAEDLELLTALGGLAATGITRTLAFARVRNVGAAFQEVVEASENPDYKWPATVGKGDSLRLDEKLDAAQVAYATVVENATVPAVIGDARIGSALATDAAGQTPQALKELGEIVEHFASVGYPGVSGKSLFSQADLHFRDGQYGQMRLALERIISEFRGPENRDANKARKQLAAVSDALAVEQESATESVLSAGAKRIESIESGSTLSWTADGGPYVISETLTVPADAVLTIGPGTEVRFGIQGGLRVEGRLEAKGTPQAPIQLSSVSEASLGMWWTGIEFAASSGADPSVLNHVRFATAETPILARSGVVIASDCVFEKSTRAAVHSLIDGKVTVKNSDMLNGDFVGVNCESGGSVAIEGGRIAGHIQQGVRMSLPDDVTISGTVIENNRKEGVLCREVGTLNDVRISNATIRDNGTAGIQVRGEGTPKVINCTITGHPGAGIVGLAGGSPMISGGVIENNKGGGVRLAGKSESEINEVVIKSNGLFGIKCEMSSPKISGNEITGNSGPGVWIEAGDAPTLSGNHLAGNTGPALRNNSSNEITATGNWWGSADAAAVAQAIEDQADKDTLGKVNVDPVLKAAP